MVCNSISNPGSTLCWAQLKKLIPCLLKKLKNNKIKLKIVFFSFYFNFPKFLYFTTELYENNLMPLIPF